MHQTFFVELDPDRIKGGPSLNVVKANLVSVNYGVGSGQ